VIPTSGWSDGDRTVAADGGDRPPQRSRSSSRDLRCAGIFGLVIPWSQLGGTFMLLFQQPGGWIQPSQSPTPWFGTELGPGGSTVIGQHLADAGGSQLDIVTKSRAELPFPARWGVGK